MKLENEHFRLEVREDTGAISSLLIKRLGSDLIGEGRLNANFRICLPIPGYECNYLEGMERRATVEQPEANTIRVSFHGLSSAQGSYEIDLSYTISLQDDTIRFASQLTNHTPYPISEFWFPRLGGWTSFGETREAKGAIPEYLDCRHRFPFFKQLPWGQPLGADAAEWHGDYPGLFTMPWLDIHDEGSDTGLYLGYHDEIFRKSTWHAELFPRESGGSKGWMDPAEAAGLPVGMVFSHVRYPFIAQGESFASGEFILRVHEGDWHEGSKFYGKWFRENFPIAKSPSWLRKKSSWFTTIIYQPEDKVLVDYEGYDQWCREAEEFGIKTFELIGWDKGGIERDYPDYVPEEKFGGRPALQKLLRSIHDRDGKCLLFVNYNFLDQDTEWFKKELHAYASRDTFGTASNWESWRWGESTLLARKGYTHRHLVSSVIPQIEDILTERFVALAQDGADGLQIDKVCINTTLDFNPLNSAKPDVALCENFIHSLARVLEKCRRINPAFRLAAEAGQDRLIPYVDVFYRNMSGNNISPLRYVFPEWTACQHIAAPYDFRGVNGAVLTGAVICVEPFTYQGSLGHPLYRKMGLYIQEIERIRKELADIIFLGSYYDTVGATVKAAGAPAPKTKEANVRLIGGEVMIPGGTGPGPAAAPSDLVYRVHGHHRTDRRAMVVANDSDNPIEYRWDFLHRMVGKALLYEPFCEAREVDHKDSLIIQGASVQILVEVER